MPEKKHISLLDAAKNTVRKRTSIIYGEEEQELCIAWAKGEIGTSQVCNAWGKSPGTIYAYLAQGLEAAARSGKLVEKQGGR